MHLCNERQSGQEVGPEGAVAHVVLGNDDAAPHNAAAQVVHHDEGGRKVVRDVQDVDNACSAVGRSLLPSHVSKPRKRPQPRSATVSL